MQISSHRNLLSALSAMTRTQPAVPGQAANAAGATKAASATSSPASAIGDSSSAAGGVRAEFDKYMSMTPAQKMHASMLQRLGITEEAYKAMSPEERAKVDKKIQEMIKEEVKKTGQDDKKGMVVDVTA